MSVNTWTPTAFASETKPSQLPDDRFCIGYCLHRFGINHFPKGYAARAAGVEVIRYESVRHRGGKCLALLTPEVFRSVAQSYWENTQGWTLTLYPPGKVVWQRTLSSESWTFEF